MKRFREHYHEHQSNLWIAQAVVLLGTGLLIGMSMRGTGSTAPGMAQEDHS